MMMTMMMMMMMTTTIMMMMMMMMMMATMANATTISLRVSRTECTPRHVTSCFLSYYYEPKPDSSERHIQDCKGCVNLLRATVLLLPPPLPIPLTPPPSFR